MDIHIDDSLDIKWGIFIHKLTRNQRQQFVSGAGVGYSRSDVPKGYWVVLKDDDDEQNRKSIPIKSIKYEMASVHHLMLIYQILHHYYMMNIDNQLATQNASDNSPLRECYCIEDEVNDDEDEKGKVEDHKFRKLKRKNIRFYIKSRIDDNEDVVE